MLDKKILLESDIESARIRGNFGLVRLLAAKYEKKYSTILNVVAGAEAWHLARTLAHDKARPWDSQTPDSIVAFLSATAIGADPQQEHVATRIDSLDQARRTLDYGLNFQVSPAITVSLIFYS